MSKNTLLAGTALAVVMAVSSAAQAQNCTGFTAAGIGNLAPIANVPAGAAAAVAGALGNVSTAFFTQQTSAFVAGASAEGQDQQSGGVWMREVGGHVQTKSETAGNVLVTAGPTPGGPTVATATGNCASTVRQNYFGVQAGADIARLNVNGWNLTWGSTVGYLQATGQDIDPGAIRSELQVPFIGTYAVAINNGFFSDIMVRREFYNVGLTQPGLNLHNNQAFAARGWSVSVGAGYNLSIQDGFFVEPSAGFIWSRTQVDPLTFGGPPTVPIGGTLAINDIESQIGRVTLRAGRNFSSGDMAWQPFGSISVFREFAPNVTATSISCPSCAFVGGAVTNTITTSTTRVGTYAQASVGVAGQVVNTGWVGFARADYRAGENIQGWALNGGLRYNYKPEAGPRGKMVVKGPVRAEFYNWSGFYIGAHVGAMQGRAHDEFAAAALAVDPYIAGHLFGAQAGFNFQNGPFVIGVEGEVSGTNAHGARACGTDPGTSPTGATVRFTPLFLTCANSLEGMATAAVRAGFVPWWSDRTLFYVKGGAAVTRETVNVTCVFGPNNDPNGRHCRNPANVFTDGFSGSDVKFGALAGFGTEFALTANWSAKAEFAYIWFGDNQVRANDGTLLNIGANLVEAKVGVNYHFVSYLP
ncbi:MAG: autotransporter domain-containing protein [Xanthobacteraceae bacterium]